MSAQYISFCFFIFIWNITLIFLLYDKKLGSIRFIYGRESYKKLNKEPTNDKQRVKIENRFVYEWRWNKISGEPNGVGMKKQTDVERWKDKTMGKERISENSNAIHEPMEW